jgi:hypothetical protein
MPPSHSQAYRQGNVKPRHERFPAMRLGPGLPLLQGAEYRDGRMSWMLRHGSGVRWPAAVGVAQQRPQIFRSGAARAIGAPSTQLSLIGRVTAARLCFAGRGRHNAARRVGQFTATRPPSDA